MSPSNDSNRPYISITGDAHGGASIDAYREYLDPEYRDAFDAWRSAYRNPSKKHIAGKKTKNWDSAERVADLAEDGVIAEVIFPNTVPPFYDTAFHVSPPPKPEACVRSLRSRPTHRSPVPSRSAGRSRRR